MIQYFTNSEIDREKWDECIKTSSNPLVYASSWYLDKVCPKWHALVEDDYRSVFPLTWNKKFGFNYLFQPFFTQQLGLFSGTESESVLMDFLEYISKRFSYIEISLNEQNEIQPNPFLVRWKTTHHLNLQPAYDILRENYSENTRNSLAGAESQNLSILHDDRYCDLIQLFRENLGKQIKKIQPRHFLHLQSIMEESIQQGLGKVISAYTEKGHYCAGAFFIRSFNRYIYLFSSTNAVSRKKGAMFAILDKFIQDHSGRDAILDFEGSDLKGLAHFFRGFGAKAVKYPGIIKNNLPPLIRRFKPGS